MKPLHLTSTKYFTALLMLGVLVAGTTPVLATHEHTYVIDLQNVLAKAADQLTKARVALQLCLEDEATCISNLESLQEDIVLAKSGVENAWNQLQELEVPEKYAEVHVLALDGLVDLSVALELLLQGLDQGEAGPIELAVVFLELGRSKILAAYERIAEAPPEEHAGISALLWPLLTAMAAVIALNSILVIRSVHRTSRRKRTEASRCSYCGQEMKDWKSYPTKIVQGWMADHVDTYHSRES